MSKKAQMQDFTSRAEWSLRERGVYYMPNDEPGLAYGVYENLQRTYPHADLSLNKGSFGGEAEFRSEDHLGFKSEPPAGA